MPIPVFLSSIEHEVGEERPIGEISALARDSATLEYFLAMGLKSYRRSDRRPAKLAGACLARTFSQTGLDATEIDAVVFATTTFWDREFYTRDIASMCREVGIPGVPAVGISMAECGNFATALRTARNMVLSGDCRNVLVVVSDVCDSEEGRLMTPQLSVLSDGAASCLVSSQVKRGFEVMTVRQTANHAIREIDSATQFVKILRFTAGGIKSMATELLRGLSLDVAQVSRLVTNNYNLSVLRVFAMQCGFGMDRLFLETLAPLAHVYSADNLINLQALPPAPPGGGDLVMTLSTGVCTWGSSILKRI